MIAPRVLLTLALAVTVSLLSASPAFAIFDHNELQAKFPTGCPEPSSAQVQDLAVDETRERVYVYCDFPTAPNAGIFKLTYGGAPSNWQATKPYIAGNELIGNPGAA